MRRIGDDDRVLCLAYDMTSKGDTDSNTLTRVHSSDETGHATTAKKKYHCGEFAQGEEWWCCESGQRYHTGALHQTGGSTMPLRTTETRASMDPSF